MAEEPIKQLMDRPSERRTQIVLAAFECLARDGFEGLRMRGVADAVGINVATLHYHFPAKEDLVRAVVAHTQRRFGATLPAEGYADDRLRDHLAALHRLLAEDPRLCQVLGEIALRAHRDPLIADILRTTEEHWFTTLHDLLERGVSEGRLDQGLDPAGVAALVMTVLKGACLPAMREPRHEVLDRAIAQLAAWIGLDSADPRERDRE
jgi:AcrR family transcriptional regulator